MPIKNRYERDIHWDQVAEELVELNKKHNILFKPSSKYILERGPGGKLILKVDKKLRHEVIWIETLHIDERPKDGWLRTNAWVTGKLNWC